MKPHGTTPEGVATEEQAARWIRNMFGEVAPRYDFLNHLLSLNIDRHWRAQTVKRLQPVLGRRTARVVDICCGTGDLLAAMKRAGKARCFGTDFCHPMLTAASEKRTRAPLFEADALSLPIRTDTFDLLTVAFGFRNLTSYRAGLNEMLRVLKPGGTAAILEFSTPPNAQFRALYDLYSREVLPRVGAALSGSREAYTYLPESVRKFPDAGALAGQMRDAGFCDVEFERMTFGIVALHTGTKP